MLPRHKARENPRLPPVPREKEEYTEQNYWVYLIPGCRQVCIVNGL